MQTPDTKEHGPVFAELQAHFNILLTRQNGDLDCRILTAELICEGQEDFLSTLECMKFEEKPPSVRLEF